MLMKRSDGTFELIGTSRNLEGLARWVLSFGTDAEVQGPDQLRRRVAAEALRIWARYKSDLSESARSRIDLSEDGLP
jgi:predicted DNA-binding transcriptional regulator YafY